MNVKYLTAAVLVMITTGCGYRVKATTAVNPKIDLSSYDSFFLMKGNSSGSAAVDDRLMSSVKGALLDKGWVEGPEGEGGVAEARPRALVAGRPRGLHDLAAGTMVVSAR